MKPLGWDGTDEGLYWPKSVMAAGWGVYYAATDYSDFRLVGAEILRLLKDK